MLRPAPLLLALACLLGGPAPVAEAAEPVPLRWSRELGTFGEQSMRYTLAVPKRRKDARGTKVPLVLALHYGGEVTPWYGEGLLRQLVAPGVSELTAVLVAPDCPGRGWTDPVSERAVLELLDHLIATQPIDPDRVILTGFSLGGAGTWFLGSKHPERFAAAIPIAGVPRGADLTVKPEIPWYVIHSPLDEVIAIGPARDMVTAWRGLGADVPMDSEMTLTHFQVPSYAPHLARGVRWAVAQWKSTP